MTITFLDQINHIKTFFEFWFVNMKSYLKYEHQYKRVIMGLSSIVLVKPENVPPLINEYMKVIIDKLIEITKIRTTKKIESINSYNYNDNVI